MNVQTISPAKSYLQSQHGVPQTLVYPCTLSLMLSLCSNTASDLKKPHMLMGTSYAQPVPVDPKGVTADKPHQNPLPSLDSQL